MNSSKLKLVLIILFLAVDLFFLHKTVTISKAENTFTEEEIASTIKLISSKGINISPENIPKEKNPPKTLKLDWDVNSIDKVVKKIIRSDYGSFKIPNGHSFTNDTEMFSVFYDYSFEYTFLNSNETGDSVEKALQSADKLDNKAVKKYDKILNALTSELESNDFKISVKIEKYVRNGETDYISASQYINGCKVDGAEFVTAFENDRPIFAAGTFYISSKVSKYSTNAHDSLNILFELEATENEIVNVARQYFPVRESESSVYITPAYKFTYDDGISVLYDATSGKKRK